MPGEIAQLVWAGIAAAQAVGQPAREERVHTSRFKMENPKKFDGKSSSTFNQWWESVTMYLGFYPETVDHQKIAWVGTLLTDTTLVWHLHQYRELGENDTWVNYSAAIRSEYRNEREAVDAQLKLGQLKYQGSIRAYLTEFWALNNFARATGEALRKKVDLAMPDTVLDMCWNCFSPLRCGAPTEATPQQRRRQQRRGEQRHGNDNGKGILVTTAWHSSIAASFALFLLYSYILLHSILNKILVTSTSGDFITRQQSNHLVQT